MNAEDLTELERAGRSCAVCHSRRGWRRFEILRPADGEPIVLCGSCRARFGDDPPVRRSPEPEPEPDPKPEARAARPRTPSPRKASPPKRAPSGPARTEPARIEPADTDPAHPEPGPDRLRAALTGMPPTFSTAMAARAAGLADDKTLARLQDLERRGEIQRVGKRWSTESPPSDLDAAIDRLEARTSNLRIVRDRERVG